MKPIIILSLGVLFFTACKKKDNKPTEYFSFDADGVHYEYPQEETKGNLFVEPHNTIGAGPIAGNLGYTIYAHLLKDPVANGAFRFIFAGNNIPIQDTIILDGNINTASIMNFNTQDNNYELAPPLTGKIIFTERSSQRLTGFFEFEASQTGGQIIHITNGKFSIILAQEQP